MRSYFENLYSTKKENLKEMNRFLDRYHLPKLNQDQIKDLNRLITPKKIEAAAKSLPCKNKPGTRRFQCRILPYIQGRTNTKILLKLFHKVDWRNIAKLFICSHNHLCSQATQRSKKKNYRPNSLINNVDAKILNKILVNRIQQHIKKNHPPWSIRLRPRDAGMV